MVTNILSGKSTLIGVLTSGGLDDGRGAARSLVLRYVDKSSQGLARLLPAAVSGISMSNRTDERPQ